MKIIQLISVLCFVIYSHGSQCINDPNDPCLENNYQTLNDHTRSIAYFDPQASTKSDHSLLEGWYRSISPAGGDIATAPPDMGHCQSLGPIWTQGSIPSVAEGIVQRTACIVSFTNNCSGTINICVKNCVDYRVYYLYRPSGSSERYCFGNETECPSGYGSSNGFAPGCQEIIVLLEDPTVSYAVEETRLNERKCQGKTTFQCSINHNVSNSNLEVVWSVGGTTIKTEIKTTTELPAQLTSDELASKGIAQYGFTLKCQVKARDTVNGVLGNARSAEVTINFDLIKSQLQQANPPVKETTASVTFEYDCQTVVGNNDTNIVGKNDICWDCEVTKGCTKKQRSCIIDNVCYGDGATNPTNLDELCSPYDSQYMWTSRSDDSLGLKIGLGVTGALLVIVLVILAIYVMKGKRGEKNQIQTDGPNSNSQFGRAMSPPPSYCAEDPYIADGYKRAPTPVENTGLHGTQKNMHY